MKKILIPLFVTILSVSLVLSCKKSATTNACANTNIVISDSVTNYTACPNQIMGSITLSASGSTGFTYSKNGGAYQASNVFSNLSAGVYTMSVKDANGCTNTKSITVGETAGPNFINVRTIIRNNCGGSSCHLNGGNQKNQNYDNECNIVTNYLKINTACVTNSSMPQSAPLSQALKDQITAWVNAGHGYAN